MAPKKSKQEKMSIGDFLNDQSLGSWADEMETQPMPSAPSSSFGGERRAFSTASSFGGDRPSYADRGFATAQRDELPLPTRPPFTAHLGNLSFEVTEGDVQDFLGECQVTSVRLVEDKLDKRPKGFGYVEFGTLDGLKKALTLSGSQFQGRNIRISVAEPPKDRGEAREISDWTRKGPLPELPGQGMRRSSERTGGFEPAAEGGERGPRRGGFFEGDGKVRDFGNWERKGPLSPPPGAEPTQGGRGPRGPPGGPPTERRSSPAWGEGTGRSSEAGSRPPRPERVPTAADADNQWRARMKPDAPSPVATPDASVPSSPQASAAPIAPASRPRLNLAKRTVSEAPPAENSPTGSSIFGGAKPVDTRTRDAEIEKKKREAEAAKKEADDKAREEKKAREAAAKAERPEKDARDSPRENGKSSDRKGSDARSPAGGNKQQYEILRRMNEGEDGEADHDGPDASANGEIVQDKETKPQEVVREVPAGKTSGGGAWRKEESAAAAEPSSQELEDDGFTVVSSAAKKGKRGGSRALAS